MRRVVPPEDIHVARASEATPGSRSTPRTAVVVGWHRPRGRYAAPGAQAIRPSYRDKPGVTRRGPVARASEATPGKQERPTNGCSCLAGIAPGVARLARATELSVCHTRDKPGVTRRGPVARASEATPGKQERPTSGCRVWLASPPGSLRSPGLQAFRPSCRQCLADHVGQLGLAVWFRQQQHAGIEPALMHDGVVRIP